MGGEAARRQRSDTAHASRPGALCAVNMCMSMCMCIGCATGPAATGVRLNRAMADGMRAARAGGMRNKSHVVQSSILPCCKVTVAREARAARVLDACVEYGRGAHVSAVIDRLYISYSLMLQNRISSTARLFAIGQPYLLTISAFGCAVLKPYVVTYLHTASDSL